MAVHVTVVAPSGNVVGALLLTVAEQLSDTVGVPSTTPVAVQPAAFAASVTFAGALMLGVWMSLTVTVKLHIAVLPAASVTVKALVVMPMGNVAPDGKPAVCAVVAPAQLSLPTGAVYVMTFPQIPVVLVVEIFTGAVIVGGSLSNTVTVKVISILPAALPAEIVTVVVPLLNVAPLPVPPPLAVVALLKV